MEGCVYVKVQLARANAGPLTSLYSADTVHTTEIDIDISSSTNCTPALTLSKLPSSARARKGSLLFAKVNDVYNHAACTTTSTVVPSL